MSDRIKATLILDPDRREAQLAYLADRVQTIRAAGDQLWAAITEEQAARLADEGIAVQLHPAADWILLPAGGFDPVATPPLPPRDLQAPSPPAVTVVQFVAPIAAGWIAELAAFGSLVQTLGPTVALFRLAASVPDTSYVRWSGPFHPAYAIGRTLTDGADWLLRVGTAPP
ncbi:MAG TPA: hypothetical protein VI300_24380, partial [Solirubrobacter sp.]